MFVTIFAVKMSCKGVDSLLKLLRFNKFGLRSFGLKFL